MPKPGPKRDLQWYANYRVRYDLDNRTLGTWQQCDRSDDWMPWKPVAYDDVPDAIWRCGKRDGWQFYTLRTEGTENGKYFKS